VLARHIVCAGRDVAQRWSAQDTQLAINTNEEIQVPEAAGPGALPLVSVAGAFDATCLCPPFSSEQPPDRTRLASAAATKDHFLMRAPRSRWMD